MCSAFHVYAFTVTSNAPYRHKLCNVYHRPVKFGTNPPVDINNIVLLYFTQEVIAFFCKHSTGSSQERYEILIYTFPVHFYYNNIN